MNKPFFSIDGRDISEHLRKLTWSSDCRYLDTLPYKANRFGFRFSAADIFLDILKQIDRSCGLNLYRGQTDADLPLLPSAHRQESPIAELARRNVADGFDRLAVYRWRDETDDKFQRRVELALRSYFQLATLAAYRASAHEWGINDYDPALDGRSHAHPGIRAELGHIVTYLRDNKIPWSNCKEYASDYIQAQHHGIDTPMLDFTSNSKVAVDFATRNTEQLNGADIVVWAITADPPFSFYCPYDQNQPYFQSQGSYMLLNSAADIAYYESGNWLSFESRLFYEMPLGTVFEVRLPSAEAGSLRSMLDQSLFQLGTPSFESVKATKERVEAKRKEFRSAVYDKIVSDIDWDNVPVDSSHRRVHRAAYTDFCSKRCNKHCNTAFSSTFK